MNNDINKKLGPEGIGGWLIVIAIILVISIVGLIYALYEFFIPLWVNFSETSEYFSSISNSNGWYSLILFETAGNIIVLLFTVYVAWLFFTKNYKTPKMFILLKIGTFLFACTDFFFTYIVVENFDLDEENVNNLSLPFMQCLIWVPYFLTSLRVKNTFVKGKKTQKLDNLLVN